MPDLWMDVDINLSEVPVNIMPLLDDTDFKSRETGITYDQAGMDLVWNFVTTGGAFTQTAVTPTTAGNYDWTNQGDGMYTIEIIATGGASINNDTEGFGWFTGFATGVLPWRGPTIGFRAAGLNNALIDNAYSATRGLTGTAVPDAAADAAGGLPISDAGGLDMDAILSRIGTPANLGGGTATLAGNLVDIEAETDDIGAAGAGLTAIPTIATVTTLTNLPAITSNWLTAAGIAASALNGKGDWNIGKTGYALSSAGVQAIWDALTSALTTAGSIGKLLVDNVNATISSRASQASVDTIDDFLDTEIGAIITTLGTPAGVSISADIAAIEAQTDDIGAAGAGLTALATAAALATVQADTDNIQTRLPAALVSGRMDSNMQAAANGVITALVIATDAINSDALAANAITEIQNGLATAAALTVIDDFLDTEITTLQADVSAILADTGTDGVIVAAASKTGYALSAAGVDEIFDELRAGHNVVGSYGESFFTIESGAAIAGTLSTTQMSTNLTEATDDHYNGRILIFTSGALLRQATDITAYNGTTKVLTFTALTEAPTAADKFIIV